MEGIPFSILIVEDDPDDRVIIDEAFIEIGYEPEVKKFINGEMLLRYLEKIDNSLYPSLIVLDNTLPKMNAADLLKILKADPRFKKIPIVIYSTTISPQKKEELMALGAYACIEKAWLMQEIVTVAKEMKTLAESNLKDE